MKENEFQVMHIMLLVFYLHNILKGGCAHSNMHILYF